MDDISRELSDEPRPIDVGRMRQGPPGTVDDALAAEVSDRALLAPGLERADMVETVPLDRDEPDPEDRTGGDPAAEEARAEVPPEESPPDEDWPEESPPEEEVPEEDVPEEDAAEEDSDDAAPQEGSADEPLAAEVSSDVDATPLAEPDASAEPVDDAEELPPLTDPVELSRVLLAVLLTSREPITIFKLAQACNAAQRAVHEALDVLERDLREGGFPLSVRRVGDAARVLTVPEVFPYLRRLKSVKKTERLSRAAIETLAVVAYRQPVMRAEIEAIRGVKVGPTLRTLLDHKLVDVVGRADVPGRPLQYGTTGRFLDQFGLASLDELPSVKELKALE
ncbi:MAG: SMC-Scp complex subunit ScpB [Planctomycetota bacterium]